MTEAFTEYTWLSTQRPWNINRPSVFQMENQLPLAFINKGPSVEDYSVWRTNNCGVDPSP